MWIKQKRFWSYIFKSEVVWGFDLEDNTVYLFNFLKHCCSSWSSPWHLIYHSASTEYSNTVPLLIFRCKQKLIFSYRHHNLTKEEAEYWFICWKKLSKDNSKYPPDLLNIHYMVCSFFLFLFGFSQTIFVGSILQELKAATLPHDCNFLICTRLHKEKNDKSAV